MFNRSLSRYRTLTPWQEMARLQREMNQLFSDFFPNTGVTRAAGYPAMNVWSNADNAVVTAELPGINPDDIDISVTGNVLTLSGERKAEAPAEGARYHRQERSFGRFTRTFELPFQVDANNVEAHFRNGVLQVMLPRAEADKPKKINIHLN